MGDSKTMTKETSSSYALEVALRHLRERCEKQAQRIKVLEEENKRLIQNKSDLFSEIGKLQENNIRLRERNITLNHEVHEKHQSLCEAREKLLERQASGGDEERGLDSTTRVSPAPVSRRRGARTTSQESTALGEAKSEDGKRSVVVIGLDGGTEGDSESSEQELDGLEECSMNVNQTLRQILEQKKSLLLVLQALTTAKEELQAKLAVQASSAQKVQSNNNNNNNHPFATTMNGTTTPGVRHQDVTASPSLFEEHRICPICLWQCDPNASTVDGDLDDIFETHVIRHLEEEDSLEETLKTFAPGTAATTS